VLRGSKQLVPELVRNRAAQHQGRSRVGLLCHHGDQLGVDRNENAASHSQVDKRRTERQMPRGWGARLVLQPQNELTAVGELFRARGTARIARHPAFDPLQGKARVLEDPVGRLTRGRELLRRHRRVVVDPNRYEGGCEDEWHRPNVRVPARCLNAREVTRRRIVGDTPSR
jgi:hypothetical protein